MLGYLFIFFKVLLMVYICFLAKLILSTTICWLALFVVIDLVLGIICLVLIINGLVFVMIVLCVILSSFYNEHFVFYRLKFWVYNTYQTMLTSICINRNKNFNSIT